MIIIDSIESLQNYLDKLFIDGISWEAGVMVYYSKLHEVKVTLVREEQVVAEFKPNFSAEVFFVESGKISRNMYGLEISEDDSQSTLDLNSLPKLNKTFCNKSLKLKKGGRTGDIKMPAKRHVLMESHMRCMFDGCGVKLSEEGATGEKGYFGYLAHIVPASVNGPRGNEVTEDECRRLVSDPSNIMLLCDKCHRLIDKVAALSYPISKLRLMRAKFVRESERHLDLLKFDEGRAISFLCPYRGNLLDVPQSKEISQSMRPFHRNSDGSIFPILDLHDALMDDSSENYWQYMVASLSKAKVKWESLRSQSAHSFIYAAGRMPALIGLGAILGNKAKITPIMRSRELGKWSWNVDSQHEEIQIQGIQELSHKEGTEVAIIIATTAYTNTQSKVANEVTSMQTTRQIVVTVDSPNFNALSGHEDGPRLQHVLIKLFNTLKDQYGITDIHLLPCASNHLCVHIGMAIERFAPRVKVYDFSGDGAMKPILQITPQDSGNLLATC